MLAYTIDELAAAYGWSKQEILETVYPDEVEELRKHIKRRAAQEHIEQLNIQQSTYWSRGDRLKLWQKYQRDIFQAIGAPIRKEKLDRDGIRRLKVLTGGKTPDK